MFSISIAMRGLSFQVFCGFLQRHLGEFVTLFHVKVDIPRLILVLLPFLGRMSTIFCVKVDIWRKILVQRSSCDCSSQTSFHDVQELTSVAQEVETTVKPVDGLLFLFRILWVGRIFKSHIVCWILLSVQRPRCISTWAVLVVSPPRWK